MDLCHHVIDVEALGIGSVDESFKGTTPSALDSAASKLDSGLEESKAELLPDSETGLVAKSEEGEKLWKGLVAQKALSDESKSGRNKEKEARKDCRKGGEGKGKSSGSGMGEKFLKAFNKPEEASKERASAASSHLNDVLKGTESLTKGLQAADRLNSLKVPQAMVAFAQAAAKVNELPGWPLLSPPKSLMKKCEKCSREFFSTLNYRRHVRLHRRSLVNDKDLRIERSQLASYWSKLSAEEANEVLYFQNMDIENLSGTSAVQALKSFIQQPSLVPYPHAYMKAGSVLLDVVQRKASLSAEKLLKVLDDASEGTMCGGTSVSVQRFVGVEKAGLEEKNVVASMSFLVEQTLLKAWMAERDVEAMRCEKALVEEEEAAQRKRAKILEKKQQRRIRQKGQKESQPSLDPEAEAADVLCPVEEDEYGSSSSSVVSSGQDLEAPDSHQASSINDAELEKEEDEMENGGAGAGADDDGGFPEESSSKDEALVDQNIGRAIRDRLRSAYTRRDGLDFRQRRNQYFTRGDTRKKLTGVYRGIVKGGSGRVVWTRKVSQPTTTTTTTSKPREEESCDVKPMECSGVDDDVSAAGSLLVGSLTVPLGEFPRTSHPSAPVAEVIHPAETRHKLPPVKVWKAVVKSGDQAGAESARSVCSEKSSGEYEQAFPPKLNVVVKRPGVDCLEMEESSTCLDFGGASVSPSSELLASFLSERWATAVEARSRSKQKAWPVKDYNSSNNNNNNNRARNFTASSCGKSAGQWHRNLKEKHSEQRYMPRRQISMA